MNLSEEPIHHLPTREGYDRWAEIYDAENNPLIALEEPLVAALLGNVRGLAIADVGCGTGRHALRLAEAGAAVTALDFSPRMLEQAKDKPGAANIHFIPHDLAAPLPLSDRSFDLALCCLVRVTWGQEGVRTKMILTRPRESTRGVSGPVSSRHCLE